MSAVPRPAALAIGGSDSGGGAGIQADLRTFAAFGVHGASAIAALTAQDGLEVRGVLEVPAAFVILQARMAFEDASVVAVKTGMLGTAGVASAVAALLAEARAGAFGIRPRVVVDPVLASTGGTPLLPPEGLEVLRRQLLPLADVLTPNLAEAAALLGHDEADATRWSRSRREEAAVALRDLGAGAVLLKGGHAADEVGAADVLVHAGRIWWLEAPRVPTPHAHGTGCTLAAAIAAGLARAWDVDAACREAKRFVTAALESADPTGRRGAPDQLFGLARWERAE